MSMKLVRILEGPLKGQVVPRLWHLAEAEVQGGYAEWAETEPALAPSVAPPPAADAAPVVAEPTPPAPARGGSKKRRPAQV